MGEEILGHALFEIEAGIGLGEFGMPFFPSVGQFLGRALGLGVAKFRESLGEFVAERGHLLAEFLEVLEVTDAAFDLLVENETVKTLVALLEPGGDLEVGVGDEPEPAEDLPGFRFRFLDSLRNGHFLFAVQQGDLPHLPQIHPDRVIENVEAALASRGTLFPGFLTLFIAALFGILDRARLLVVDFGRIDDAELHQAESLDEILEQLDIRLGVGNGLVDVVVSEVILLLGEADEITDDGAEFRRIEGRGALDRSGGSHDRRALNIPRFFH